MAVSVYTDSISVMKLVNYIKSIIGVNEASILKLRGVCIARSIVI